MEKLIIALQEAEQVGVESFEFKQALHDYWLELARLTHKAKITKAKHKTNCSIMYNDLRATIKTDAERCRVIDYELRDDIEEYKLLEAEAEQYSDIYWSFKLLIPAFGS